MCYETDWEINNKDAKMSASEAFMAYIEGEHRRQHTLFPTTFGRTDSARSCLPCDRGVCGPAGHEQVGFRSLRAG